jgi:hypothetical protein
VSGQREDDRRGDGSWLGVVLVVVVLVGAKPAGDLARHHPPAKPRATIEAKVIAPPPASASARAEIPATYLALYRGAAKLCPGLPWGVLAGIGKVETNHGRSRAPGVVDGVNAFGCCAGPMQFNIRNGPPSTWDTYGRGGNVYDPRDAIPAATRMLCANGAPGDLRSAIFAYNHAGWYVDQVLALARSYQAGRG